MKKVITTVGTSIFSNYQKEYDDLNDKLSDLEDEKFDKNKFENSRDVISIKTRIKKEWLNDANASAEISSILKIYKEEQDNLEVYLLSTDTILSALAAQLIKEYFLENNNITIHFNPDLDVIKGLQVRNFKKFEEGKNNLIKRIHNLMKEFVMNEKKLEKHKKFFRHNVIFNITGGYKGIIPLLTITAQLFGCKIKYKFEDSNNLISIPRIPINFDPILTESLYIDLWFKKENPDYKIKNIDKLKEFGFIYDKEISALGELFYDMVQKNHVIGENVFGYFVEYKILEYLHIEGKEFNHSYKENNKRELDFVFQLEGNNIEVWEIKPALDLRSRFDKILEQIKNQFKDYKTIKKYKIILYSLDERIKNKISDKVQELLKELKSEINNACFAAEFLLLSSIGSFKKQNSKANPYQVLFDRKLTKGDFLPFNFN